MARVARFAGALLVETEGRYFLVGNTKGPCDFVAAGFEPPVVIDALERPYMPLSKTASVTLDPPWLTLSLEGEPLARAIAARLLIDRNGSVSDRLWRLLVAPDGITAPGDAIDARWLVEVPEPIWRIVRDAVLRCT